ncbi:MAG: transposase [Planctomycetota bacterium]
MGAWELFRFGKATKTNSRKSVAAKTHDHNLRLAAKNKLKYNPVCFSGRQALSVSRGFNRAKTEGGYSIYACSILPDHVHMIIGWHKRAIGRIVGHLKAQATRRLSSDGLWEQNRRVWAKKSWKVFLDTNKSAGRAIKYVKQNPVREGKKRQNWSFLDDYSPII